jgi:hypothetical protein
MAQQGKFAQAESLLRKVAAQRANVNTDIELAEVLLKEGKLRESESLFNSAISETSAKNGYESTKLRATTGLGSVYASRGQYAEAENLFRQVISTSRNDYDTFPAKFAYADMLMKAGRKQEAAAMLDQAQALKSNYLRRIDTLR